MHETEAFILEHVERREADFLYTLYTKDFGLIRATAQGVRKEGAKLRGHLEPFSKSGVIVVSGKSGYRLTGAVAVNHYPHIRSSLYLLQSAMRASAIVGRSFYEEKDAVLWGTLNEFFDALATADDSDDASLQVFFWFCVRILEILGYRPSADTIFSKTPRLKNVFSDYENNGARSAMEKPLPNGAREAISDALGRAFEENTGERFGFFRAPFILETA